MIMTKRIFLFRLASLSMLFLALVARGEESVSFSFGLVTYSLVVEAEFEGNYDRDEWPHWFSLPDSCMTVRDKVLAEESLIPVTTVRSGGRCRVTIGLWICPYTGERFTDSSDVDVDHVVPLAEAFQSGGHAWDRETRRAYANDLSNANHLMIVDDGENQSKSAGDPTEYLPRDEFLPNYLEAWVRIKTRWGLSIDPEEVAVIQEHLERVADVGPAEGVGPDFPIGVGSEPSAEAPSSTWKITYVGSTLVEYNSVGQDWDNNVKINGRRVRVSQSIELDIGTAARLEITAIERDEGQDDVGVVRATIRSTEGQTEFGIAVTVRENGGRYSGNEAIWEFSFHIE